jgi:hypothetical protein
VISVHSFVALKKGKALDSAHCTAIFRSRVIVKFSMVSDCYLEAENSFLKILVFISKKIKKKKITYNSKK